MCAGACAIRTRVGLARTIYIRCIYGNFGREITKYTVIYGVYIQFWPTLNTCCGHEMIWIKCVPYAHVCAIRTHVVGMK